MKKILIPTNFSDCSRNAADFVTNMFHGQEIHIVLAHACDPAKCTSAENHAVLEAKHNADLDTEKKRLLDQFQGEIEISTDIYEGSFAYMPNALKKTHRFDLVAVGTDGLSEEDRYLKQTNTERFVTLSKTDVLIIPNGVEFRELKQVLLAADYHFHSGFDHFDAMKEIIHEYDAQCFVLHVEKDTREKLGISKLIQKKVLQMELKEEKPEFHEISENNIETGIQKFINTYGIDLVCMVPRKHSLAERMFKYSVTKKIAEVAKIPVLVMV